MLVSQFKCATAYQDEFSSVTIAAAIQPTEMAQPHK